MTSTVGLKQQFVPKNFCKDNKKANIMTTRLMSTTLQIVKIVQNQGQDSGIYLHQQKCHSSTDAIVPLSHKYPCPCLLIRTLFGPLPESVLPKQLFLFILNKCLFPLTVIFRFTVSISNSSINDLVPHFPAKHIDCFHNE